MHLIGRFTLTSGSFISLLFVPFIIVQVFFQANLTEKDVDHFLKLRREACLLVASPRPRAVSSCSCLFQIWTESKRCHILLQWTILATSANLVQALWSSAPCKGVAKYIHRKIATRGKSVHACTHTQNICSQLPKGFYHTTMSVHYSEDIILYQVHYPITFTTIIIHTNITSSNTRDVTIQRRNFFLEYTVRWVAS